MDNDNDNTISNIMSLAKLFTGDHGSRSKSTSHGSSWPMFPIDAQIHTEPLRVCKSLIPYLPYEKQKNLCIFVKIYELISIVDYFSAPEDSLGQKTNFRESKTWPTDLLYSVKENLDPENAFWVDILFKFKDVKTILESAQSEPSPAPTLEAAGPDTSKLDDQQKKILEMLSTIMK